jgi:hypothetical protein
MLTVHSAGCWSWRRRAALEGGAEAGTTVKWCLSQWRRKGGWCKADHGEGRSWLPLLCLLGE